MHKEHSRERISLGRKTQSFTIKMSGEWTGRIRDHILSELYTTVLESSLSFFRTLRVQEFGETDAVGYISATFKLPRCSLQRLWHNRDPMSNWSQRSNFKRISRCHTWISRWRTTYWLIKYVSQTLRIIAPLRFKRAVFCHQGKAGSQINNNETFIPYLD